METVLYEITKIKKIKKKIKNQAKIIMIISHIIQYSNGNCIV